jgi:hypothetical protein
MQTSVPPATPDRADQGGAARFLNTPAHLERVGKAGIVVLASLFALGLLVTNTYLLQFGLSEFGLLRARFVLTGLLTMFPTMLNLGCLALAYWIITEFSGQFRHLPARLALACNALIVVVIGFALPVAIFGFVFIEIEIHENQLAEALLVWVISFLPILPFLLVIVERTVKSIHHRRSDTGMMDMEEAARTTPAPRNLPVMLALPMTILAFLVVGGFYVELFARHIYPNVPEQFGGGRPYEVQLLFRGDSTDAVARMHIPVMAGSTLSEPLTLLWHSDSGLMVEVPFENEDYVILIDGSLVTAIIFNENP